VIRNQTPPAGPNQIERNRRRRIQRAWWNERPLIDALGLTPGQRTKMDEVLARRMRERHKFLIEQRRAGQGFQAALVEGNWAQARSHADAMSTTAKAEATSRAVLRIDIFEILTPAQRRILVTEHSHILSRPWLPGFGRRRPMPKPPQPPGKGSGSVPGEGGRSPAAASAPKVD